MSKFQHGFFSQDIEDLREEDCVDIYLYKLQCATQSENPREKIYLRRSMVEVSEEKLLFLPQDSNDKVKGKQRVLGRDFLSAKRSRCDQPPSQRWPAGPPHGDNNHSSGMHIHIR